MLLLTKAGSGCGKRHPELRRLAQAIMTDPPQEIVLMQHWLDERKHYKRKR